jgi:hypothetical protein
LTKTGKMPIANGLEAPKLSKALEEGDARRIPRCGQSTPDFCRRLTNRDVSHRIRDIRNGRLLGADLLFRSGSVDTCIISAVKSRPNSGDVEQIASTMIGEKRMPII